MLFTDTDRRFATVCLSEAAAVASKNLGGIQDVEDSTLKWLQYAVRNLLKYCQKDLRVDELQPQQIYDWHTQTIKRASAITANNYLRAINIIFKRLLEKGIVAHNPASYVPYAEEPPNFPKAIRYATYEKMRKFADYRALAMIDLLWASGCRIGGLLSINLSALKIWNYNGEVRLAAQVQEKGRADKRKRGKRSRYIYAQGKQAQSVKRWLNHRPTHTTTEQLFTTLDGHPLQSSSAQSILRKLRQKAGISAETPSNFHAFRHAFALRKLDDGIDIATVSSWLGHKDPAFTARVYCIRSEEELRRKFFQST